MVGTVVAIYQSASGAEMALRDLLAAKVPSAVIKRVVKVPAHDPHRHIVASGVAVIVEEKHASVVKEIMDMHAPVAIEERSTPLHRAA
jgi:hypothetical protein